MLNFTLVTTLLIASLTFILLVFYYSFSGRKGHRSKQNPTLVTALAFTLSTLSILTLIYLAPLTVLSEKFLLVKMDKEDLVSFEDGLAKVNVYHEPTQVLGHTEVSKENYKIEKTNDASYVKFEFNAYDNVFFDAILGSLSHSSLTVYQNETPNMTTLYSNGFLYPPGYSEEMKAENDKLVNELNKIEEQLKNEQEGKEGKEDKEGKEQDEKAQESVDDEKIEIILD